MRCVMEESAPPEAALELPKGDDCNAFFSSWSLEILGSSFAAA